MFGSYPDVSVFESPCRCKRLSPKRPERLWGHCGHCGSLPGVKRPERDGDHLHIVPR